MFKLFLNLPQPQFPHLIKGNNIYATAWLWWWNDSHRGCALPAARHGPSRLPPPPLPLDRGSWVAHRVFRGALVARKLSSVYLYFLLFYFLVVLNVLFVANYYTLIQVLNLVTQKYQTWFYANIHVKIYYRSICMKTGEHQTSFLSSSLIYMYKIWRRKLKSDITSPPRCSQC